MLVLTDFATMAKLLLVSPIALVPYERAFSAQSLLKTRLRSLSEGVLESLMRVHLEGPLLKDLDVKRAAMHFVQQSKEGSDSTLCVMIIVVCVYDVQLELN